MHELSCTIARGWGEITASVWAKRAENTKAILDHQVMKQTNIKRRKEMRRNPDEEQMGWIISAVGRGGVSSVCDTLGVRLRNPHPFVYIPRGSHGNSRVFSLAPQGGEGNHGPTPDSLNSSVVRGGGKGMYWVVSRECIPPQGTWIASILF